MFFAIIAIIGILIPQTSAEITSSFIDASYVQAYESIDQQDYICNDDDEQDDIVLVKHKSKKHQKKHSKKKNGKFFDISDTETANVKNESKENTEQARPDSVEEKADISKEFAIQRIQHLAISIAQDLGYSVTIS